MSVKKYKLVIERDESYYDYREYCEDRLRYDNDVKYLNEEKKMTDAISMDYVVPMMPKSKKIHILKRHYNEILNSKDKDYKLQPLKGIENVEVWGQNNEELNNWIRRRRFIHKLFELCRVVL